MFLKNLKCIKLLECIKCLSPEYISSLRYSKESRSTSSMSSSFNNKSRSYSQPFIEDQSLLRKSGQNKKTRASIAEPSSPRNRSERSESVFVSTPKISERKFSVDSQVSFKRVCCCLFSSDKNDFYSNPQRRKSENWPNESRRGSRKLSMFRQSSGRVSSKRAREYSQNQTLLNNLTDDSITKQNSEEKNDNKITERNGLEVTFMDNIDDNDESLNENNEDIDDIKTNEIINEGKINHE